MKINFKSLVVIYLTLAGHFAFACPTLDLAGGYAELAVPCTPQGLPDFSQQPAVNQADHSGGECRTVLESGKSYSVRSLELVLVDNAGTVTHLGVLTEKPSCFQTDHGGPFYSTWIPIHFE